MVEKMETGVGLPTPTKVEFNTIIKNKGPFKAEEMMNRVLYAVVALLLCCVLSTFFVKKLPDFVLDLRSMAIDSIWLMACCYVVGELVKLIFFNKGRCTSDYDNAKKGAETALNSLTADERATREEYCKEYAKGVYNRKKKLLLSNAMITEEEYNEKYALLTYRELKARYKNELSKAQRKMIAAVGRLRLREYDPAFFASMDEHESDLMPSEMHNARKQDKQNKLKSAVLSVASSFFCVTLAGELIFSFSLTVLFMAVVKVTSVVIFSSFKATFGWNLAMYTEISRYRLQVREVANLKDYYKKKCEGV
jgi:hypothetical protein